MATVTQVQTERRFFLSGIPWQVYLALRDLPENRNIRMTYDRGELEMMSPSRWHEQYAVVIDGLIRVWALELDFPLLSCRTLTCRREDLARGFEPDNCYYVKNEPLLWDKPDLDLTVDPPPDLAIEVDLGSGGRGKMQLYAAFGVPELWRYDGETLQVYELSIEGRYVLRESSPSFPQLPLAEVQRVLGQVGAVHEITLLRGFRDWVRAEVLPRIKEGPPRD